MGPVGRVDQAWVRKSISYLDVKHVWGQRDPREADEKLRAGEREGS